MTMTLTLKSCMGVGMALCKILDQYLSSHQTWTKSIIGFGNNEVLKILTFVDVDANANADTGGSTIALREPCSGELKSVRVYSNKRLIRKKQQHH